MMRKLAIPALVVAGAVGWFYQDQLFPPKELPSVRPVEHPVQAAPVIVEGPELRRLELLASLAGAPPQGALAALPWYAITQIGKHDLYPLENLLASDPALFLEMCLHRYEQKIQGYKLIFNKRERVAGKLRAMEKVEVHFREKPFSVHMNWIVQGASAANKVLYVEGENSNQMQARPRLLPFILVKRDIHGAEAKSSGRYTIDQFGFYVSTKRTLTTMRAAQARGALHVKYAGTVRLAEVGDRLCYKFVRTPYEPLEEDEVNELVLYIDTETWLQVGSVLRDAKGELIAEYFFRDIQLNPQFGPKQFTSDAL